MGGSVGPCSFFVAEGCGSSLLSEMRKRQHPECPSHHQIKACAQAQENLHDIPSFARTFPVRDYDLATTLTSGQVFRWERRGQSWIGVIGKHWVRLRSDQFSISAEAAEPVSDWAWLTHYLDLDVNLETVLQTFPDDAPMRVAVAACSGLRLLRQDPWECLASFILSSTKQIVQIRQIISLLCSRYGEPVIAPSGYATVHAFPSPGRLALAFESELRACKMGFRAPNLLAAARRVGSGQLDLAQLHQLPLAEARNELMQLAGVGPKIADCVLLFAYGLPSAFPLDVWVMRALQKLYFPGQRANIPRLRQFAATHFGLNAGYAQQYLFHYIRTKTESRAPHDNP
jgi:N-glycosylase/DNA lyase